MSDQEIRISAVICAYTEGRWDRLVAAVASIKAQAQPVEQIILVIDHNPSLLGRARALAPDVIVIENTSKRGLSGARNSGIAAAAGDLVAFLDDDAVASPDWLQRLASWFSDPRVMGAGGFVEPLWERGRPSWFPEEFDWVVGCSYRGLPTKPDRIGSLFGGCLCIRRGVFEGVGGFRVGIGRDRKIPMGCEDTELCIRAGQYWPERIFRYDPGARVFHHVPASRCTWRYFKSRCFAEGLSKALLIQSVGSRDGLAAARAHAFVTLPAGVLRSAAAAIFHGNVSGLARAGAIAAGLACTAAGYALGRLKSVFGFAKGLRAQDQIVSCTKESS